MYLKLNIFLLLNFFLLIQCKSNTGDENRKTANSKKEIKFPENGNKNIIKEVGKKNIEVKNKTKIEPKTVNNKKKQLNKKQSFELQQSPQNFAGYNSQNPYFNKNIKPQNIINNSGSQNTKNPIENNKKNNSNNIINTPTNRGTNINNKPNTLGINIRTNNSQQLSKTQDYNQLNNNPIENNFTNNQMNSGIPNINTQNPNSQPNNTRNPIINSEAPNNTQINNNNTEENINLEEINNTKENKKRATLEDYSNTEHENANKIYKTLNIILNKAFDAKFLKKQLPTISVTFREALYDIANIGSVDAIGYITTLLVYLNEKTACPKGSGKEHIIKIIKWQKLEIKVNENFEKDYKRIMAVYEKNKDIELNKENETKKGLKQIIADRQTLINQLKLTKSTDETELLKDHLTIASSANKILMRSYFLKNLFFPNEEIEIEYDKMIKPRIKEVLNYNKKGMLKNIKDKCNFKKPKKPKKIKNLEKRLNIRLDKRLNLLKKLIKFK